MYYCKLLLMYYPNEDMSSYCVKFVYRIRPVMEKRDTIMGKRDNSAKYNNTLIMCAL